MEKVQIVRYALLQLTAMVYTILACATAAKINSGFANAGYLMPSAYYRAIFVRDYGAFFLVIVLLWTTATAYFSSSLSKRQIDENTLQVASVLITAFVAIAGTIIAITGAVPPMQTILPVEPIH
jgi:hypothetical protein